MKQRVVAEIVGPAGAGKSTLTKVLRERDGSLRTGLSVWGLPPTLLCLNAFLSLPRFVGLYRSRGRIRRDEVKLIVRLSALHQLLGRESSKNYRTLLLDEGTIFALVKLLAFSDSAKSNGNGNGRSNHLDAWTQSLLNRWARRLDAVIWLDAPDEVLAERIRSRGKAHRVKDKTDQEIYAFLARYRDSYERVISELNARHGLKVIRFSTEHYSLEEMADQILAGMQEGI
ncbi:MAG TPA: AAA family ATPase [Pyrinomonadaceae bacterium]|nr:AAA family ATPase [Pyrinomonadaceae bacterium]